MPNRLADSSSPYLRGHADNPVDWYPWGAAAFEEAARRDVPVLVSIGYATCHWCHVMDRESYEDSTLADLINREYIAIKVDRDERPGRGRDDKAARGRNRGVRSGSVMGSRMPPLRGRPHRRFML